MDTGPIAVIDGHDGVGQVLAARAMREAVKRSQDMGIAAVAVRNSNHFGTAAYFTRMAAASECVGILVTNASPAMAPWGGRSKLIGSNPWSIAAPAGRRGAVVMDIANTVVARGKIYIARQQQIGIPRGWALNAAGEDTADPNEAIDGVILPMEGHKGYVIALMMDVLSGVLSGSSFGSDVAGPYQFDQRSGCGHLAIAIRVESFIPIKDFNGRMDRLLNGIKSDSKAAGFSNIYYPGELEEKTAERSRREGLALPDQTLADLRELASETGVPPVPLRKIAQP